MKRKRRTFGIHSQEEFDAMLRRERSRSDRNGHQLSLVLFDVHLNGDQGVSARKNGRSGNRVAALLARAMKARARAVDILGWFDDRSIGAVLPNTPNEGGGRFAGDIARVVSERNGETVHARVYTYPGRWLTRKSHFLPEKHRTGGGGYLRDIDPLFSRRIPVWKRSIDISGALLGLLLASPLFVLVPLLVRLVSPGPGFYRQERVGRGGRLFNFLKFRTMYMENDAGLHRAYLGQLIRSDRPMVKLDHGRDRRIIPLGRFIRKACIDELPQLINVLKGEMSLVGPRPCLPYEAAEYLKWHAYRFDINPGITGLWQVSGKNRLTFREMISLDITYAERMSPWLDLWILAKTVPSILLMLMERPGPAAGTDSPAVETASQSAETEMPRHKQEVYS